MQPFKSMMLGAFEPKNKQRGRRVALRSSGAEEVIRLGSDDLPGIFRGIRERSKVFKGTTLKSLVEERRL